MPTFSTLAKPFHSGLPLASYPLKEIPDKIHDPSAKVHIPRYYGK